MRYLVMRGIPSGMAPGRMVVRTRLISVSWNCEVQIMLLREMQPLWRTLGAAVLKPLFDELAYTEQIGRHLLHLFRTRVNHGGVWRVVQSVVAPFVVDGTKNYLDNIEPGTMFIVGVDDGPWCCLGVGAFEHFVLYPGEIVPALLDLEVDFAEFPLFQWIGLADLEAFGLYIFADAKVELDQDGTLAYQILFEPRNPLHEVPVLLFSTELEYRLHHCPVVPAAVEDDDFSASRKLRDVFLEIPLAALFLARFAQGDDTIVPRVHVKSDALDGPALTGRVTPFEQDDHAPVVFFQLLLELDQLSLVWLQLFLLAIALDRLAAVFLETCVLPLELIDAACQRCQRDVLAPEFHEFRIIIVAHVVAISYFMVN